MNRIERKDYISKIEENFEEQIKTLQELVSINSEEMQAVELEDGTKYPFGEGVQKALEYTLSKGEVLGFEAEHVNNYGGHMDFGNGEELFGIIGHLDVVPAGNGWSTDPFGGEIKDGYIWGRGTTDDKGPVVACMYAMKALRDVGFTPYRTIRLILGLDEETGSASVPKYLEGARVPDFGFTPDGDFPLVNGEMGITIFDLVAKLDGSKNGLVLESLIGGNAPNMVPDKVTAKISHENISELERVLDVIEMYKKTSDRNVEAQITCSNELELVIGGVGAHGASPHLGINAISITMELLGKFTFADSKLNSFIEFYNNHIKFDLHGENLGCHIVDDVSGELIFNVGMIKKEDKEISIVCNGRVPVTHDTKEMFEGMANIFKEYNLHTRNEINDPPLYMDADTNFVRTMMESYIDITGDKEAKPMVIGGGTYAKHFDNVLAYGATFAGEPDVMHQKDERLSIEKFKLMTEIYAEAIFRLASEEFQY